MRIETADGSLRVATTTYSLAIDQLGRSAALADPAGEPWASLLLDSCLHTTAGLDETVARGASVVDLAGDGHRWSVSVELASARWRRKVVSLSGDETALRFSVEVEGTGSLTDVELLGGWSSAEPWAGTGFHASGAAFRSVMSPGPSDPARLVRPAGEPATLDVSAGSGPGRGNWFFTPPPLCWCLSRADPGAGDVIPAGPWLTLGIGGRVEDATFGAARYVPGERSFSIRLEYEGQTRVDGRFVAPSIVLLPGAPAPYGGLRAWADELRAPGPPDAPAWWREPIFCGWGAQCALAAGTGTRPADHSTERAYDGFLAALEREGVEPGTIVIDDRWQRVYGLGEPDTERWPDMAAWIERRHALGQRVLLWWKCWDPEGIDPALCVRSSAGVPVTVDPSNPGYEALLRREIRQMLGDRGAGGLDADGLKVDFSGLTPSGPSLARAGREWGVALLHRLLAIIHDEAHRTKQDGLVITHTPHPWFGDVTDMLRLNDMLRLSEPDDRSNVVKQMVHRARIVAAAMPDHLIDTDDWCAPDLAAWRRYAAVKPSLGVPSLYYATSLDLTGEQLAADDYATLRESWAAYRRRNGLPQRSRAFARGGEAPAPLESAR